MNKVQGDRGRNVGSFRNHILGMLMENIEPSIMDIFTSPAMSAEET